MKRSRLRRGLLIFLLAVLVCAPVATSFWWGPVVVRIVGSNYEGVQAWSGLIGALITLVGVVISAIAIKYSSSRTPAELSQPPTIDTGRPYTRQLPPLFLINPVEREQELNTVLRHLLSRISIVITGISGIGKSTLLAVAVRRLAAVDHLYTDICFHRIAERDSDEERLERLLLSLVIALDPSSRVESAESSVLFNQVKKLTTGRTVLFAIDNANDEASQAMVQMLLDRLPEITLAITSTRLLWQNIMVYRLEGMSVDECMRLFEATLDKPLDQVGNPDATELCNRMQGHPMMITHLALEANAGKLSLSALGTNPHSVDIDRDLSRRFDVVLSRLPRECHRALDIIGLLDTATVRIDLVKEVGHVSIENLEQLRDEHLLYFHPDRQHLTVHELVRRWRQNKLDVDRTNDARNAELAELQLKIAGFYCQMIRKIRLEDAEGLRNIDAEWPNILGLIDDLSDPVAALTLVDEIIGDHFEDPNGYVPRRKQTTSLLVRCKMLQRYTSEVDGLLAARVEKNLGHFFYWHGDHKNAESLFLRARDRYKAAGDLAGEACCVWLLGYLADDENRYSEAEALYRKGTKLVQQMIPPKAELISAGHHLIGCTLYHQGRYGEAEKEFFRALGFIDKEATPQLYSRIERRLGSLALEFNRLEEAETRLSNALASARQIERPRDTARISRRFGLLYLTRNDLVAAEGYFNDALSLFTELQAERGIGYTLCGLSQLRQKQNRLEEAKELCRQSLTIAKKHKSLYGEATAYEQMGKILEAQKVSSSEVTRQYQRAYNLYQLIGHQRAAVLNKLLKKRGGIKLQFPEKFSAVLFDLMDTLAYLNPERYEQVHQGFADTLGVSAERFNWAWNNSRPQASLGAFGTTAERIEWVANSLEIELADEKLAHMVRQEEEMWASSVELYTGTVPLLQTIRQQNLRLGIVCNGSIAMASLHQSLGLASLIDSFTISCKVGSIKPEPAIYAAVLDELKLNGAECVFIGDGNDRELDGARELGMYTIKVNRPRAPYANLKNESRAWEFEVNHLEDLKTLFDARVDR